MNKQHNEETVVLFDEMVEAALEELGAPANVTLSEELEEILKVCPYCKRKHARAEQINKKLDNDQFHKQFTLLIEAYDLFSSIPKEMWREGALAYDKEGFSICSSEYNESPDSYPREDVATMCGIGHWNDNEYGHPAYRDESSSHPVHQAMSHLLIASLGQEKYNHIRAKYYSIASIPSFNDTKDGRMYDTEQTKQYTVKQYLQYAFGGLLPANFERTIDVPLDNPKGRVMEQLDRLLAVSCPWNPKTQD